MPPLFENRSIAGKKLGLHLCEFFNSQDSHKLEAKLDHFLDIPNEKILVIGLARGGIPVAAEVALSLNAQLDIFIVKKVGAPQQQELAVGAVASGGVRVLNDEIISSLHIPKNKIDKIVGSAEKELHHRESLYRGGQRSIDPTNRCVIIVDDGLATGATMRAAVTALRPKASQLIVAIPVGAAAVCDSLRTQADEVICLYTPDPFYAVGLWYQDFGQTSDEEIKRLMAH